MGSHYGSGSEQNWLSQLRCTGYEHSLAECQHGGWGADRCHQYNREVSIMCGNGKCNTNTVLLERRGLLLYHSLVGLISMTKVLREKAKSDHPPPQTALADASKFSSGDSAENTCRISVRLD